MLSEDSDLNYNDINQHEKICVPSNVLCKLQIPFQHRQVPYGVVTSCADTFLWRTLFSISLCDLGIVINVLEMQLEVKKVSFIAARCHYGNRAVTKSYSAATSQGQLEPNCSAELPAAKLISEV